MSFYSREFAAVLGCSEEDAARIEVIVRWEHSTLNAMSKAQLRREARIAAQVLERLRSESRSDAPAEAMAMLAQIEMESRSCA